MDEQMYTCNLSSVLYQAIINILCIIYVCKRILHLLIQTNIRDLARSIFPVLSHVSHMSETSSRHRKMERTPFGAGILRTRYVWLGRVMNLARAGLRKYL
jgi:hypothetical protein